MIVIDKGRTYDERSAILIKKMAFIKAIVFMN